MEYLQYIKAELLVLVVVLYALGMILKNTQKIKDNMIPVILTGLGIVLACLYVFGTEGITLVSVFTGIVQGVLCSAGAVYSNQLFKQRNK